MSTLSLRKIKHDSASVDNITLNSDGTTTANRSIIIDTTTNGVPSISLKHANTDADNFIIQAGTPGVTNGGLTIRDIDAAANRLIIDSVGRVTIPSQPFFYAKNASESGDGITTSPAVFTNVVRNVGGHFSTSGAGAYSRFTAPISGVYFFSGNPGYKQSSIDFAVRLRINNIDITDVIRFIGGLNSHSGTSFSTTIYLSANDYVDLNMAGNGSAAYHRNNSSVPNWFSGGLLY
jgi:hypothetical protein